MHCLCHGGALLPKPSLTDDIGVELDAAIDALLEHALDFVIETREAVERATRAS
jgi:hypothetical protein